MLMSELVTHASAEKCGDLLKVRQPTQGALHKGATLIIMVLFFLKHSTNLLWLGTSTTPEPSSRGKKGSIIWWKFERPDLKNGRSLIVRSGHGGICDGASRPLARGARRAR